MTEPTGIPFHPPFTPKQLSRADVWDETGIVDLVTLEPLDELLFRNRVNQRNVNGALFGGQVLAQALAAACGTITPDRPPHSLHGYFLRSGQCDFPVMFQVERTRDGGSFSTRRVTALQHGRPILHMECSFHVPERGFDHQVSAPAVPAPEDCPTIQELMDAHADRLDAAYRARFTQTAPFEMRPVGIEQFINPIERPERALWLRIPGAAATDNPLLHQIILAYLSDYWLGGTPMAPHRAGAVWDQVYVASLDHALWFHRPARADEWLLYQMVSPSASAGTGLTRGEIFDRSGALVATVMQETLFRQRD